MRKFQKLIEQAEFIHQLKSAGMNRVASKIPQEVRVFLEDENFDARARQEIRKHHARRPATRDATPHIDLLNCTLFSHSQTRSFLATQAYQVAKTRSRRLYFKFTYSMRARQEELALSQNCQTHGLS